MPRYHVEITGSAEKQLRRLSKSNQLRVTRVIVGLAPTHSLLGPANSPVLRMCGAFGSVPIESSTVLMMTVCW